jgi:hypothetical protein
MPWCWILIVTEPYEFAVHEESDENIREVNAGLCARHALVAPPGCRRYAPALNRANRRLPSAIDPARRQAVSARNSPREKVVTIAQECRTRREGPRATTRQGPLFLSFVFYSDTFIMECHPRGDKQS